MDFKEYQQRAGDTAFYPGAGNNYIYPALGLTGEAGEIANKIKKIERDAEGVISDGSRLVLQAEIGDLLWYVARLSTELGLDLNTVAEENLKKLARRKADGTLHGSGDSR